MLRLYAQPFTRAFQSLARMETFFKVPDVYRALGDLSLVLNVLDEVDKAFVDLPVPASLRLQVKTFRETALITQSMTESIATEFATRSRVLGDSFRAEMSALLFLVVDQDRQLFCEQSEPLFGQYVATRFPDANKDIAEAGRCFALDRWTASVFHLMRVLELGLRAFAVTVEVPEAERKEWKYLIDQIEKRIGALQKTLPSGLERDVVLQFYSAAATNFRYFKDAWRNHAMHARKTYDEHDAISIWAHVRDFMQVLAAHGLLEPEEEPRPGSGTSGTAQQS